MKKTILVATTLVLLFALTSCGTTAEVDQSTVSGDPAVDVGQAETAEVPAQTLSPNFDLRLIGEWVCVSAKEDGLIKLVTNEDGSIRPSMLCFIYDGGFFGELFNDSKANAFAPIGKATTQNGAIDFHVVEEGEQLTVTYEVQDITNSSLADDIRQDYFAKFADDQLTLRFVGSYQSSPTTIENIDSTLVFEKQYPMWENDHIFEATLVGSWIDNYGNAWTFTAEPNSSSSRIPNIAFSLTDTAGKRYPGESISCLRDVSTENDTLVSFYFDSAHSSADIDAKLISFDGYELILEQKNGTQLILQRVS